MRKTSHSKYYAFGEPLLNERLQVVALCFPPVPTIARSYLLDSFCPKLSQAVVYTVCHFRRILSSTSPHNRFPLVISFVSTPDRDNRSLNKKLNNSEFSQPSYPTVVSASLGLNYLLFVMLWVM